MGIMGSIANDEKAVAGSASELASDAIESVASDIAQSGDVKTDDVDETSTAGNDSDHSEAIISTHACMCSGGSEGGCQCHGA